MKTLIVRMKDADESLKLKKGDILEVEAYFLDPSSKYTILRRLSDDFDPEANVYMSQVEIMGTSDRIMDPEVEAGIIREREAMLRRAGGHNE